MVDICLCRVCCERMDQLYFIVSSSDSSTLQGRWEVGLTTCLLDTASRLPVVKQLVRSEEGVGVWSFDPLHMFRLIALS